jgi:hypothetical protein
MTFFRLPSLVLLFAVAIIGNLYAKAPRGDQPLPPYQMGITGIHVIPGKDKPEVTVGSTEPGSPAAGTFQTGDVILAVNGVKLALPDSRVQLGGAITMAEASDGKLMFIVNRGGATQQVTIDIPVLGAYSKTWPVDCAKTRKIVDTAAAHAAGRFKSGELSFAGREGSLTVLFLLSTGRPEHVAVVRDVIQPYAKTVESVGSHTWNNGFKSLALAEYYLRTGDELALKPLKLIVDDSYERMTHGGWGHWDYPNPGYVRSGLVNAAGGPLFVGMVLARECGVEMDEADFRKNLKYFYRFAGFGGVPYGDQRPGGGAATNGKSGMAGVGFSLIDEPCYQAAAHQYAIEQADSFSEFEGGHTGNMTNVLWRGLSATHVPESLQHHYRRHMDELQWYYELCRHPRGDFQMLPTLEGEKRYATQEWGMCIGLTYTAAWGNLRITGAPPTEYSVIKPVGKVMEKNVAFVTPRHAEGYKESDFEPLQTISEVLKWNARRPFYKQRKDPTEPLRKVDEEDELPPIDYIVKHFRHYNPVARTQAANAIGYYGDEALPEIAKALSSTDPRVRRAGLDALSGYQYFFMAKSPFTHTATGIDTVVPQIVKILQDPESDMWEIEGALWAISTADQAAIAKHLPMLTKFLKHDEWWVRSAAFVAISEARSLAEPVMLELIECFAGSSHVSGGNDYVKRLQRLINEDKVAMSPAVRKQVVLILGEDLIDLTDRERSYVRRGTGYYDIRNIRVLLMFEPDELANIADFVNLEMARIGNPDIELVSRTNYQNLAWLLIGDQWGNPGLIPTIKKMTPENQAKMMPGLKSLLAGGLDKMFTSRSKGKAVTPAVDQMEEQVQKMLDEYERKHGTVKPYPVE